MDTEDLVDTVHDGFCIVDGDCYVAGFTNMKQSEDDWWGLGEATPLRIGDKLKVWAALRPRGRNRTRPARVR